jgi:hypothetical protein
MANYLFINPATRMAYGACLCYFLSAVVCAMPCSLFVFQGFSWFTSSLKVDADGDAAHAFLGEHHSCSSGTAAGVPSSSAAGASSSSADSPAGSSAQRGSVHQQEVGKLVLLGIMQPGVASAINSIGSRVSSSALA